MKIGIIGHTSSGRSTLFQALTGRAAGSPGGRKTQLGIARVMDRRVDRLSEICKPKKTIYAEVVFALPPADPSAPVAMSELREMRDLRAFAHVVGAFADPEVEQRAAGAIRELSTELVLADLERVDTRQARIAKGGGARPREEELLERARACLDQERPLRLEQWDEQLSALADELGLVSHRPLITVVNVGEEQLSQPVPPALSQLAQELGSELLWLCAALEAEIAALQPEEQQEYLAAYGLEQPISQRFVRTAFALLNQVCFFTVGPDEVRAWPIARDTGARRAARTIHTDLERGFIRAEVITYDDFLQHGSESKCRTAGVLRTEGKEYIVQDGDIINVRFNV